MKVTDYNGNIIDFTGTAEEALRLGHNVNCDNCSYCSGCSDCSDCSRCSDCSGCSGCSSCSRCSGCSRCSDCSYCSGCSGCSRCSSCSRCSDCSWCSECSVQPILNTPTDRWVITLRANGTMKIGCQDHPVKDWLGFDDERIDAMSPNALDFWRKWKPVIQALTK